MAARERTIISLYCRGANFAQIGRQLAIDISTVAKEYKRAVLRLPKADVEALRKLEAERIQDMRFRLWSELGGQEREVDDPDNPGRKKKITVRPEPELVVDLVEKAVKVSRHEKLAGQLRDRAPRARQLDDSAQILRRLWWIGSWHWGPPSSFSCKASMPVESHHGPFCYAKLPTNSQKPIMMSLSSLMILARGALTQLVGPTSAPAHKWPPPRPSPLEG